MRRSFDGLALAAREHLGEDPKSGALFVFTNKRLTEIRIHPIEMGYDFSSGEGVIYRTVGSGEEKYLDGSPRMAYGASGQWILKRLQHLNSLRGTDMEIRGNVGVIRV